VRSGILEGDVEWITDFPDGVHFASEGEDPQTPAISLDVTAFSRPVLTFRIKPAQSKKAIRLYVCHFKSKAPTRIDTKKWFDATEDLYKSHTQAIGSALPTIRRTAEAAASA